MSEALVNLKNGEVVKAFPFSQAEKILQIDSNIKKRGGQSVWSLSDDRYTFDGKLKKKKRARTRKADTGTEEGGNSDSEGV